MSPPWLPCQFGEPPPEGRVLASEQVKALPPVEASWLSVQSGVVWAERWQVRQGQRPVAEAAPAERLPSAPGLTIPWLRRKRWRSREPDRQSQRDINADSSSPARRLERPEFRLVHEPR